MFRFPDIDFVIFDLEWSVWENQNYILEIGAIKKRNGLILDKFYKLLKYNLPISEKVTELTGITNFEILDKGEDREKSILQFLLFIEGAVLVSHDVQNDLRVLKSEAYRLGLEVDNFSICTLKLSQKVYLLNKYNLYNLAEKIELDVPEKIHRANIDAHLTCQIFNKIIDELPDNIINIKDMKNWNTGEKKLFEYKIKTKPEFDNLDSIYRGFFDGASSGNPGKMGIGFAIIDEVSNIKYAGSQHIGNGTNNEAEYVALISLLKVANLGGIKNLKVFGDSQLVVKQIKGEWQVKAENLKPLFREARELTKKFKSFSIDWIRREENTLADDLSKKSI